MEPEVVVQAGGWVEVVPARVCSWVSVTSVRLEAGIGGECELWLCSCVKIRRPSACQLSVLFGILESIRFHVRRTLANETEWILIGQSPNPACTYPQAVWYALNRSYT